MKPPLPACWSHQELLPGPAAATHRDAAGDVTPCLPGDETEVSKSGTANKIGLRSTYHIMYIIACMHVYMHTCIHAYMHIHIHIHTHIHILIQIHIHIYIHIIIYIYIKYIYIYTSLSLSLSLSPSIACRPSLPQPN